MIDFIIKSFYKRWLVLFSKKNFLLSFKSLKNLLQKSLNAGKHPNLWLFLKKVSFMSYFLNYLKNNSLGRFEFLEDI